MQAPMLIALSAGSLRGLLVRAKAPLALHDLPTFVREELDLRGLNFPTDMLAGKSLNELDKIRDRADRVGCPCLLLQETEAVDLAGADSKQLAAMDRLRKVALAANRLGCAFVGLKLKDIDSVAHLERATKGIRAALIDIDRWDVSLLFQPSGGLLESGSPLVDLVKRVGGFRIGALASFQHAHDSGDLRGMLRRIAPYAQAMIAQIRKFNSEGQHEEWSLTSCIETLRAVGYSNMLSLDFVGKGDGIKAIVKARDALVQALHATESETEPVAEEEEAA